MSLRRGNRLVEQGRSAQSAWIAMTDLICIVRYVFFVKINFFEKRSDERVLETLKAIGKLPVRDS